MIKCKTDVPHLTNPPLSGRCNGGSRAVQRHFVKNETKEAQTYPIDFAASPTCDSHLAKLGSTGTGSGPG